MTRVSRNSNRRHKKVLKSATGYWGRAGTCYRIAKRVVEKGLQYSYRDRRNKKRDFRRLWVQRINAAVREHGLKYSTFIDKINKSNIQLDRKTLANMAVEQPEVFANIVASVK